MARMVKPLSVGLVWRVRMVSVSGMVGEGGRGKGIGGKVSANLR
jgi:hypothetical protein